MISAGQLLKVSSRFVCMQYTTCFYIFLFRSKILVFCFFLPINTDMRIFSPSYYKVKTQLNSTIYKAL